MTAVHVNCRPDESSPLAGELDRALTSAGHGELVAGIVTELATEIINGNLPAGYRLTSVELGQRFGTSRTPVREALAVLQREGLVDIEPRRRAAVASLTLQEVRDIYEIRAGLYALIAVAVAERSPTEDIYRLEDPVAAMERARADDDPLSYFYGTVAFRRVEADICPNRRVGTLIDSLGLRTYRLRRFGLSLPGRMDVSLQDYQYLVQAYRLRDHRLAESITRSLMTRALTAIEENWDLLQSSPP